MRIAITYNLKNALIPGVITNDEFDEEFDTKETIEALVGVFRAKGFETVLIEADADSITRLRNERIDFVFNIAEGYYGRNRESFIPAVLEMLKIPHSGSDASTLSLTLDKTMTKKIVQQANIPTPAYWVVTTRKDIGEAENRLTYPMITKPAWEGSSKGIYNSSRVSDSTELRKSIETLLEKYPRQPLIVEEYIKGREITVCVIGNAAPQVLGMMEIRNKNRSVEDFFYSLEVKRDWRNLVSYVVPPDIPETLKEQLRRHAIVAFKEFGCRDIARIDFRISEYSQPYLLEINPLPGLSPEYADIAIMAEKIGLSYESLITKILYAAFSRYGIVVDTKREPRLDYEKI
jgi:D-alanine-D-alanine ligase